VRTACAQCPFHLRETIANAVQVRTNTKRFPHHTQRHDDPETQYNTDCGHKTMMTTAVARNGIDSSAIVAMTSRTKRFAKAVGESTDAQIDGGGYDIDTGHKRGLSTALQHTPIQYGMSMSGAA
jgi:hypothetical protein